MSYLGQKLFNLPVEATLCQRFPALKVEVAFPFAPEIPVPERVNMQKASSGCEVLPELLKAGIERRHSREVLVCRNCHLMVSFKVECVFSENIVAEVAS